MTGKEYCHTNKRTIFPWCTDSICVVMFVLDVGQYPHDSKDWCKLSKPLDLEL